MEDIRKSGLDVIGDVTWGSHFCLFYQSKEDLLDILVPYFKAGLENKECCMWVTSENLRKKDVIEAMRRTISDFDRYLRIGQIEIIVHTDWYLKGGFFDQQRILEDINEKLRQSVLKGFKGLRLSGNAFRHEKIDWRTFAEYEEAVNSVIGKYRVVAICTYSLDDWGVKEVMDAVRNHHMVLIRSNGEWNIIESQENKEARQALRRSEEQFRTAFANAPIGMALVGLDGHFLKVNKALCDIVGYSEEELLRITFQEITHPDDLEADMALTAKLFAGEIPYFRMQKRYIHKKGNIIWVSLSCSVVLDAHKRIIYCIVQIQDITERRKTENALIKSEQKYRFLVEGLPAIVWSFSDKHGTLYASAQVESILGYSPEHLYKNPWLWNKSIHPDDQDHISKAITEFAAGKDLDVEYRIKDSSGNWLWFNDLSIGRHVKDDEVIIEGVSINITDRKRAQEEIRLYSKELEESNSALKVLLRQRESDRLDIEEKVVANVKQIVLPYMEMLKKMRREIPSDANSYLNIIESNLKEIISSFTTSLSQKLGCLTPKEILIANLIKEGKADKDIAAIFHLSIDTVKAHRKNIRKKLELIGKKINLRTFLSNLT